MKELVGRRTALLGAIIYVTLPYHLAVDFYVRFAFGELWAFVWIPLILLSGRRIARSDARLPILGFALGMTLLVVSHIVSFVMFAPVAVVYTVLLADGGARKRTMVRVVFALALAVCLSAVYWLPAIGLQKYVGMGGGQAQAYMFSNNFLFAGTPVGHNPAFWRVLEVVTLLTGGLAVCAFLVARGSASAGVGRERHVLIAIAIVSLFMMLSLSTPVWMVAGPLQRIE